jgi:hypothetical protein
MSAVEPAFGGDTFEEKRDGAALKHQIDVVRSLLLGGGWYTIAELTARFKERTGKLATEASISARIRDLRKTEHGSYNIERRARAPHKRLYEYHLGANTAPVAAFAHNKTRSESSGC